MRPYDRRHAVCGGVDVSTDAYATNAGRSLRWRPEDSKRERLEVLHDGSEWNSSRAPESPLSRMRSKPWWVFRCANLISTRFLSSRDLAKCLCLHLSPSNIAGVLMEVARNLAHVGKMPRIPAPLMSSFRPASSLTISWSSQPYLPRISRMQPTLWGSPPSRARTSDRRTSRNAR
jgi:hypothetical protein